MPGVDHDARVLHREKGADLLDRGGRAQRWRGPQDVTRAYGQRGREVREARSKWV